MTTTTTAAPRVGAVRFAVATFVVALAAVVAFLGLGGGAPEQAPPGIPDPGLVVGWGLPVVKLLSDVLAVAMIGFLTLAAFLVPGRGPRVEGLAVDAVRRAGAAAAAWVVATLALYLLSAADTFAQPLSGLRPGYVVSFADSELGRGILLQAVLALVLAVLLRWTVGVRGLAACLGLALAALAPVALTGHSASAGAHDLATISLFLHVAGACLWVGGLAGLGWLAVRGSKRLEPAISRFSALATWALAVVGLSGVVNASTRLGSLGDVLGTGYGRLVLAKVVALVVLGWLGWLHRRRIARTGSSFLRLAGGELLVMAATMGLAVALARTPTPVGEDVLSTPSEALLGGPMPADPSIARFALGFSPSGFGLAVVGLGLALYAYGVLVMRRRGDRWPVGRTISWVIGMAIVAWATLGGLAEYSHVLFSVHMIAHMLLSMVAPIFLVLGAPVTLALRTLPGPRQPGEVGPRQLLLSVLHSRFVKVWTHPVVAAAIFVGSLYGLYFTPLFEALMRWHLGHALMDVHFLLAGSLFYYVLIGIDPSPRQLAAPVRFGMLLFTVPFHAFFAVAVMSANQVIADRYWLELDRPFATDLLHDQYVGGSVAWALGEVPMILVMGALLVQWVRSDRREARRSDRKADADGDAELARYNEWLAQLPHERRIQR